MSKLKQGLSNRSGPPGISVYFTAHERQRIKQMMEQAEMPNRSRFLGTLVLAVFAAGGLHAVEEATNNKS